MHVDGLGLSHRVRVVLRMSLGGRVDQKVCINKPIELSHVQRKTKGGYKIRSRSREAEHMEAVKRSLRDVRWVSLRYRVRVLIDIGEIETEDISAMRCY